MPEQKPEPDNLFQKFGNWMKELVDWVEQTFGDPEMGLLIRADLGLDATAEVHPVPVSDATKATIASFVAAQDVDAAAFMSTVSTIKALVDTGMTFAEAVKTQGVEAGDVFWLVFKLWVNDYIRVRNPSAYGLMSLFGLILEDEDTLNQLDLGPVADLFSGEVDAEALLDRLGFVVGTALVGLDAGVRAIGGVIDAGYGWDPSPGDSPDAVAAAGRALSVKFNIPVEGGVSLDPMVTLIAVPAAHGGPGLVMSVGGQLEVEVPLGRSELHLQIGAHGAFTAYVGTGGGNVTAGGTPSLAFRLEPADPAPAGGGGAAGAAASSRAAVVVGFSDSSRLEIGAFGFGVELGPDHAGARISARRGKVVIGLGQGDGFLKNLPGGTVEVPFDLGLLADTKNGIRFDGGTGLRVNLPVAATVGGVFTVQYLMLELEIGQRVELDLRGGFSVKLGPFQASVDQLGVGTDLTSMFSGGELSEVIRFLPPKGIGLRLDAGVVKGGGYLFIDPDRGEYAGALELTIAGIISVKAIALITTKRPDGSEGWSLMLLIFGQFSLHIAFGIFLTGVGGLIGLHHRVDTDALIAGMKTGALDDILFPANPVADAPRLINRYKQLFPIEPDGLVLGPMLELSFSQPPIVYVRLGLLFEVRNALGGDRPVALTKVVLLGQLLAQLPQKALGLPAIVKLLIDVVGFYDAQEKFLLIRARLRDSFVGIEGFAQLNLSGELLLGMRFGDDPSFVLSAGGFHPAFKDLPRGVPNTLERLAVSFGIGPIQLRAEQYFAITSNSVQGGFKVSLTAKLGPASIEGWLGFDALLYLAPHLHFIVSLGFSVSLKAFGATLCAVSVSMSLEGPGEWHAIGSFSFSILFWDVEVGFDESWGSAPAVGGESTSAAAALRSELSDPTHLLPEGPVGGDPLVTIAEVPGATLPVAHPLGQLSVRQKAIPLGVRIDRLGTKTLTEGTAEFAITSVEVGGRGTTATAPVIDHFARGQFMELTEADRLAGKSFDRLPAGVTVGTDSYAVSQSRTVPATYEEKILEPDLVIARFPWKLAAMAARQLDDEVVDLHVALGASARSARAAATSLRAGGPGRVEVRHDPELALVDPESLGTGANLIGPSRSSAAVAEQQAQRSGTIVVEAFEMAMP
jgi:hypothetical protein